jgi:5-methylcytosine-specific restriction endonuclease McrA
MTDRHKKYRQSAKGRASLKRRQERYRQSAKGRATAKRYRSLAKVRAANKQYQRQYRQSTNGRIATRARNKRWRLRHPETIRATNQRLYQLNAGYYIERNHRRRARLQAAPGHWTTADLQIIMEKQQYRCLCGVSFKKIKSTIDHKIPLSRGGSNWPRNIQHLCQPCNDSKGTKTMREWGKTHVR